MAMMIGKLAAAAGVGVETVRFYQRRGLLDAPGKDGGVRRYGPEDLRRLRFIRHAQAAGFTLAQIQELIALDATNDRSRVLSLAKAQIRSIDARIESLEKARNSLQRLAGTCAEGGKGPCPILAAFEEA